MLFVGVKLLMIEDEFTSISSHDVFEVSPLDLHSHKEKLVYSYLWFQIKTYYEEIINEMKNFNYILLRSRYSNPESTGRLALVRKLPAILIFGIARRFGLLMRLSLFEESLLSFFDESLFSFVESFLVTINSLLIMVLLPAFFIPTRIHGINDLIIILSSYLILFKTALNLGNL